MYLPAKSKSDFTVDSWPADSYNRKGATMKVPLNQDTVYLISITSRSTMKNKLGGKGKNTIVFEHSMVPNILCTIQAQNSLRGFGVRVGKTSKRYIVQRKVGSCKA